MKRLDSDTHNLTDHNHKINIGLASNLHPSICSTLEAEMINFRLPAILHARLHCCIKYLECSRNKAGIPGIAEHPGVMLSLCDLRISEIENDVIG